LTLASGSVPSEASASFLLSIPSCSISRRSRKIGATCLRSWTSSGLRQDKLDCTCPRLNRFAVGSGCVESIANAASRPSPGCAVRPPREMGRPPGQPIPHVGATGFRFAARRYAPREPSRRSRFARPQSLVQSSIRNAKKAGPAGQPVPHHSGRLDCTPFASLIPWRLRCRLA